MLLPLLIIKGLANVTTKEAPSPFGYLVRRRFFFIRVHVCSFSRVRAKTSYKKATMENALNRENVLAIVDELRNVIHKSFSSSERLQTDMEAEMRRLREIVATYKQTIYEHEEKPSDSQGEQNQLQLQRLEKTVIELQEQAEQRNECLAAESAKTEMMMEELQKFKEKYHQMLDIINAYELKLPKLQAEVEQCHKLLESLQPAVQDLKIDNERMRLSLRMNKNCPEKFQKVWDNDLQSDVAAPSRTEISPLAKSKYEETERDSDEVDEDDEKPECEHLSSKELHQNQPDWKDEQDAEEADKIHKETEQDREYLVPVQKIINIEEQDEKIVQEEKQKNAISESAQQLQGLWEKLQFFE